MALLYPWATKEYLLWEMTIGQIILYHNGGMRMKYGDGKTSSPGLSDKSVDELRSMRDASRKEIEAERAEMALKYGDING